MRAREFIIEQYDSMQPDVAAALPATYIIPALQNQDPYKQYRFSVAIARAKSQMDGHQKFEKESAWGENQVIVSYSNTAHQWIDAALKEIGLGPNDKKLISTPKSEESKTVNTISPIAQWNKKS